jgi:putrescine aminotransferase
VLTGGTLNNAKVNRIEPPGIISYETLDVVVSRLDETLTEVQTNLDNHTA